MTRHTDAAPSVTSEPTHAKSSFVMGKPYSLPFLVNASSVGDDHANAAPAAKAPPVAVSESKREKTTKNELNSTNPAI